MYAAQPLAFGRWGEGVGRDGGGEEGGGDHRVIVVISELSSKVTFAR